MSSAGKGCFPVTSGADLCLLHPGRREAESLRGGQNGGTWNDKLGGGSVLCLLA